MKNSVHLPARLVVLLILLGACRVNKPRHQPEPPVQEQTAAKSLIIFYDAAVGKEKLLKAAKAYRSTVFYQYNTLHGIALTVPPKKSPEEAIAYYKKVPGVLSVAEDQAVHLQQVPSAP